jgi:hypothetical protein
MIEGILAFLLAVPVSDTDFARYPANVGPLQHPVAPRVASGKAHRFRTVLRQAAANGPNFNRRYRTVVWGCGTNCVEWAIIDLSDGSVWFAPQPLGSCWSPVEPAGLSWPEWIETRIDSRLLYAHECSPNRVADRTFNQRRVYEWREGQLHLLREEPFIAVEERR